MAFGQSFFVGHFFKKAAEGIAKEVFNASEDDAKMAGAVVGGAVGLTVAVVTADPAGGAAVIGSGAWTLENT